jgi:pyridoxal phosphate enzyme (YggS family)
MAVDIAGGVAHNVGLNVAHNVELIEKKIEAACARSGRKRQEIKLMGVTKFHGVEAVQAACNAGISLFGESRVQEAAEKFSKFWESRRRDGSVELHLIGSLQRNKAKKAAALFDCIQSIDRDSIIDELGALKSNAEGPIKIMLEYHTGEETKAGFPDLESLLKAAEKVLSFPGLLPVGLMTMAPFTKDAAIIRSSFRSLVSARDELEKRFPGNWPCLSMGMTNDYEIAIEEGSTLIRLGTAIFGEG